MTYSNTIFKQYGFDNSFDQEDFYDKVKIAGNINRNINKQFFITEDGLQLRPIT